MKNGGTDNKANVNTNTVRIKETLTERTIEATFSDNVGKDLAGILRDAYSAKLLRGTKADTVKHLDRDSSDSNDEELQEAEILDNDGTNEPPLNKEVKPDSSETTSNSYPTLKAISMKNLPSSETEWIVVYSFYASGYGNNIFTREQIINQYIESNRFKKATTRRDLANFMKRAVVQEFINPLQGGFSILDKGITAAKEIISRTGSSTPKVGKRSANVTKETAGETKNAKTNNNGNKPLKRLANIDFYPKGKDSLETFYKKYPAKNDYEKNLLFVYYMQEVLNISGISYDHIYTCYDTLKLRISENLHQTVRNTKSKTGWISKESNGFIVTVKGGNQIKAWNKKN